MKAPLKSWLRFHPNLRDFLIRLYNAGWGLFPDHDGVPGPHVKRFAQQLGSCQPVLEIGGAGLSYRTHFRSNHFICTDLKADPRVDVQASVYALPFAENSVEVVLLFEVLEHLAEPQGALNEVSRVLRPGGALALTAPQYWHEHGWPSDYFRYTRHGLRHLAESSGLFVESIAPMGGPALLVSLVLSNNFNLGRDPIRRLLLCLPMTWLCYALDKIVFSNNLNRTNPDTRGWAMMARKPESG